MLIRTSEKATVNCKLSMNYVLPLGRSLLAATGETNEWVIARGWLHKLLLSVGEEKTYISKDPSLAPGLVIPTT